MQRTSRTVLMLAGIAMLLVTQRGLADDWTQFLGTHRSASSGDRALPTTWDNDENLSWKTRLPGPGSSSPIVVGESIFVTCYSGYGVPGAEQGDLQSLQRHLVCVDRTSGEIRWSRTVKSESPEDAYRGYLTEHGYASSTPVTDGQRVYCFFGKSGVLAFDLEGQQLWQVNVGQESSNRRWGSGASLVLYKDWVIVNASEESQSIRALDKKTGQEIWQAPASALELAYGTPAIVKVDEQRTDLVIAVPGELWGLNADTGKLQWYVEHALTGNICPSTIVDKNRVFVFGGYRSAGSLAVRLGGSGDVTESNVLWTSRNSSYVATPVIHDGFLYWVSDNGLAYCVNADSGELVYRERVPGLATGGRPVYASPIVADEKIFVPTRRSGVLVLAARPEFEILAQNVFEGDESDFNASLAISNHQLFLRSDQFLYCVHQTMDRRQESDADQR